MEDLDIPPRLRSGFGLDGVKLLSYKARTLYHATYVAFGIARYKWIVANLPSYSPLPIVMCIGTPHSSYSWNARWLAPCRLVLSVARTYP